jgi:hypothetical protein
MKGLLKWQKRPQRITGKLMQTSIYHEQKWKRFVGKHPPIK